MCDKRYIFISRDSNSSVYRALGQYLLKIRQNDWKKVKPDSLRFNLMLGDRNKLPYSRLGQAPGFQQLVNYYRGSESICRKCSFVREMKRHCRSKNMDLFPWFPESFIVFPKKSSSSSDTEIKTVEQDLKISLVEHDKETVADKNTACNPEGKIIPVEQYIKLTHVSDVADTNENNIPNRDMREDDREELLKYCSSNSENQIWIAKSSTGAKGDGIKISSNIQDLLHYIDHQHQSYIIQKYLHNPFLLNHRRKFDIRCWVLLDSNQQVYLFNQGVLRTASESYDISDLTNVTSHLTNHSLQQDMSKNFGIYEEGNEMFYNEFNQYLLKTQGETMEVRIIPQIKTIIKSAFNIILENLDTTGLDYKSFQLFGFDFLLDDAMKVWLLEINGAPACAQKLLPDLLESLVKTAIDPVFSTSYTDISSSSYHFDLLES